MLINQPVTAPFDKLRVTKKTFYEVVKIRAETIPQYRKYGRLKKLTEGESLLSVTPFRIEFKRSGGAIHQERDSAVYKIRDGIFGLTVRPGRLIRKKSR